LQVLSGVVHMLAPPEAGLQDAEAGQRAAPRTGVVLPVRLRAINPMDQRPEGPACTARTRDISDHGLGLIIPTRLSPEQAFAVEVFTDVGTWSGRMRLVYCADAVGGFRVGMACHDTEAAARPGPLEPPAAGAGVPITDEPFTPEVAREEIRQALRQYRLASRSWGLAGITLEREITRLLAGLPAPAAGSADPRRGHYRHPVEGSVHLVLGGQLLTTGIEDISTHGARVRLEADEPPGSPTPAEPCDHLTGSPVVLGLWTGASTLWVPSRIVHCVPVPAGDTGMGLRFEMSGSYHDFC
jgi:hypothetical protein